MKIVHIAFELNQQSILEHFLNLFDNKNYHGEKDRLGFAAGKKLGCAAVRNRVKRLLREAARLEQGRIPQGVTLLLVGRAAAAKAKSPEVQADFVNLLRRAKLVNQES